MPSPPLPDVIPVPRRWRWLGLILLLVYGVFLARHASVAAGGSDTSGYLNSARLIAGGTLQDEQRIPAEFGAPASLPRHHFMPLGFVALADNPHLPPTYPVGLPLHLAVAGKILGWRIGVLAVEITLALSAVALCFLLARQLGLDPSLAGTGAVVLAVFPVFLFTSLQPLSDTPATTWSLAAFCLALQARRSAHGAWAVAAGAAFAMAVCVRATNAALLPALLLLLGRNVQRLGLFAAGGVPGALWLGYYNHTLYGGVLRSGYGPIEQTFAWAHAPRSLKNFGTWLALLMPAALLVLPVVVWWRQRSAEVTALALWFGAVGGVYTFYEFSHETWWSLRFILPSLPPLIVGGLLALAPLASSLRRVAAVALILWAVAGGVYWTIRLHALSPRDNESVYVEASERARTVLPSNALVAAMHASGALYFYTGFPVLRWDQIGPADFQRYAQAATSAGRPIYALLFDGLEDDARATRMPGEWTRLATTGPIGLWQFVRPPTDTSP
jgi:hypothetical protein